MRGLVKLTWLEIKIFVREPMGVFGTIAIPLIVFLVLSRLAGPDIARAFSRGVDGVRCARRQSRSDACEVDDIAFSQIGAVDVAGIHA